MICTNELMGLSVVVLITLSNSALNKATARPVFGVPLGAERLGRGWPACLANEGFPSARGRLDDRSHVYSAWG